MRLKGVAFNVGSGGCPIEAYRHAILNAKHVFEVVKAKDMQPCDLLDIGAGYSMTSYIPENNFDIVGPLISKFLDETFADEKNKIRMIAEPGRLFCYSVQTSCVQVYQARQKGEFKHLYINSSVYQLFRDHIWGHERFTP
jgi:diaminopimelate decarboxylase